MEGADRFVVQRGRIAVKLTGLPGGKHPLDVVMDAFQAAMVPSAQIAQKAALIISGLPEVEEDEGVGHERDTVLSSAVPPVARFAAVMSNRHDEHMVRLDGVKNAVRKHPGERAAYLKTGKDMPSLGCLQTRAMASSMQTMKRNSSPGCCAA